MSIKNGHKPFFRLRIYNFSIFYSRFFRKTGRAKAARPLISAFLSAGLTGGQVLADHQGHLEDDGVVELAQIQAGELLDLLQAIHQGIAVDEQLPGSLGNVQIILKEFIDCCQCLFIKIIRIASFEDLFDEHLAKYRNHFYSDLFAKIWLYNRRRFKYLRRANWNGISLHLLSNSFNKLCINHAITYRC